MSWPLDDDLTRGRTPARAGAPADNIGTRMRSPKPHDNDRVCSPYPDATRGDNDPHEESSFDLEAKHFSATAGSNSSAGSSVTAIHVASLAPGPPQPLVRLQKGTKNQNNVLMTLFAMSCFLPQRT